VRLGQLNAADQVTLVFFVQVVGKIEENLKRKKGQIKCGCGFNFRNFGWRIYLRFESDRNIGVFDISVVQSFNLVFYHELAVSGQERAQADKRFVLHLNLKAFDEKKEKGKELLLGTELKTGKTIS